MKVLLIDDHALFRYGIRLILSSLGKEIEILEADSLSGALDALAVQRMDLALLDLKLNDASGLDSLIVLRNTYPDVPVIVLSGEQEPLVIHRTVDEGAMGFISKSAEHQELLSAISHIIAGGVYLPREVMGHSGRSQTPASEQDVEQRKNDSLSKLSKRQREVLQCLLEGKSNKAISCILNIAENTVKNHIATILLTLGAKNRTEAVYLAAQAGIPLMLSAKKGNSANRAMHG